MGGLSPAVTGTDDGLLQSAGNCSPPDQEPGRERGSNLYYLNIAVDQT